MHITFSMALFMDKKKYGNQPSEVEWSFLQKNAVNFTFSFFFAISFGSVYVEKLSSVVLFRVISVGPLSILEWLGLVLLGSF